MLFFCEHSFCLFETGSCAAQAGLELVILLPQTLFFSVVLGLELEPLHRPFFVKGFSR
jgi:hypothetical protein